MRKYNVFIPLYATIMVEVEANSKDEAINSAYDKTSLPMLCHECSRQLDINDFDAKRNACAEEDD